MYVPGDVDLQMLLDTILLATSALKFASQLISSDWLRGKGGGGSEGGRAVIDYVGIRD